MFVILSFLFYIVSVILFDFKEVNFKKVKVQKTIIVSILIKMTIKTYIGRYKLIKHS